jgi:hypothetical protein
MAKRGSKIPEKDRELIKKRVAQGMSYQDAMEGTVVSSKATVSKIVKETANEIEHIRQTYLKLIRKFGAKDIDRAKLWAKMTTAVKPIGATILMEKDGKTVKLARNEGVIEVPDWTNRREALKYIDNLADISNVVKDEGQVRVNVLTVVGADRKKYGF